MPNYINTSTLEYPLTEQQVRAAFPKSIFSSDFVAPYPFAAVAPTARPAASNPITMNVVEDAPINSGGVWMQAWKEVAASASDIADRTEAAASTTNSAALKNDATVQFMRTHTPAEVDAYINTNVTDLASAKTILRKMGTVVAFLARERLGVN